MWEAVSTEYASRRDPDGSDADLIDDLLSALPPDPLVVDIGCGDGARTLANLPEGSVGVDFARQGLLLAASCVPHARLLQGDMVSLPLTADVADAITAYHAVFHVPRETQPAVFREFSRILREDGILLMTLPGGRFETVRSGWMDGQMFFSAPGRRTTLEQLSAAGFSEIKTAKVEDPLGNSAEFALAENVA